MKLFRTKREQVAQSTLTPQENLQKTFNVLRLTLIFLGRFPFSLETHSDGTTTYRYKPLSLIGLYFLYTVSSSVIALTFTTTGSLGVIVEGRMNQLPNDSVYTTESSTVEEGIILFANESSEVEHEMSEEEIMQKSIFTTVVMASILANATTSLLTTFFFGKGFATYFTLWSRRVMQMDFDVAGILRKKLLKQVIMFNILLIMLAFLIGLKIPRAVRETFEGLLVINLHSFPRSIRHYFHSSYYPFIRGAIVIALWGYKIFIVFYEFFCSLLRKGFELWNQRLQVALEHGFGQPGRETVDGRIRSSYEELYKDHYRLVKLVDMTNVLFKPVLLVYYSTQIIVLCFVCFYIVHAAKDSPGSVATLVIVVIQSSALVYSISLRGSFVYEEAHKGFAIIRSYGYPQARSREELMFLESLSISYRGDTIQLTGGKYFGIDRPFMQDMAGTVVTYFIIIIQFYA